jgi:hypothetical protein
MQRILDIDLDFFVEDPVYWPPSQERCDPDEHPVWPESEVRSFLDRQCGVSAPLPGFITENHGELFPLWRDAIDAGVLVPPFHVTHVDAHADLGLGDTSYVYILTSLLLKSPEERRYPVTSAEDAWGGLGDGNHLAFAVANRWISELDYVFSEGGGDDLAPYLMEGFDSHADHIHLTPVTTADIERLQHGRRPNPTVPQEPRVPLRRVQGKQYQTDQPFDFICLTRSPPYTPVTADPIFDMIRDRYIRGE